MPADYTTSKVTTGETSSATKFNAFVQAVQDADNNWGDTSKGGFAPGQIFDPAKIQQAGASVGQALAWDGAKYAPTTVGGGGGTTIPAGSLLMYGAAAAPAGWLLCDGAAVSRVTYATLFAAIGTSYGNGDGATTFNTPDFRGRVPAGYAASGGHSDVSTLGNNEGTAAASRRPKHKTSITDPGHNHSPISGSSYYERVGSGGTSNIPESGNDAVLKSHTGDATTGITAGVSGTGTTDAPAYLVVNYIIKT